MVTHESLLGRWRNEPCGHWGIVALLLAGPQGTFNDCARPGPWLCHCMSNGQLTPPILFCLQLAVSSAVCVLEKPL